MIAVPRHKITRGTDGKDFIHAGGEIVGVITRPRHGGSYTCTIAGEHAKGANGECIPGEKPAWAVKRARQAGLIGVRRSRGLRGTDADVHREVDAAKRARAAVVTRARTRLAAATREANRFLGSGVTDVERAAHANAVARAQRDHDAVVDAAERRYQTRLTDIRQRAGVWADLVPLRGIGGRRLKERG